MIPSSSGGWRHRATAQRGASFPGDASWSQYDLYKVPPALIVEILEAILPTIQGEHATMA